MLSETMLLVGRCVGEAGSDEDESGAFVERGRGLGQRSCSRVVCDEGPPQHLTTETIE